jgi:tetratricopeptide (TPR) repeat protein
MSKFLKYFSFVLLLYLFSCGEMRDQADPIQINQEGIEFMNAGKYELALDKFLKAVKSPALSKDSKGTIYRNIALTYIELDKKDSAVHFCTLAAKCYQKNSYDYLVNLAEVDILAGHVSNALTRLQKAVKMNPEEMAVNNSLGLIYLGDYDEALMNLDKALIYNSKAFEISGGRVTEEVLGRTYYKMEDYEKAESHFEHLLQTNPQIASYALDMGMIKLKLKKSTEADKLFEKAITMDSSYKETISVFKKNNLLNDIK